MNEHVAGGMSTAFIRSHAQLHTVWRTTGYNARWNVTEEWITYLLAYLLTYFPSYLLTCLLSYFPSYILTYLLTCLLSYFIRYLLVFLFVYNSVGCAG